MVGLHGWHPRLCATTSKDEAGSVSVWLECLELLHSRLCVGDEHQTSACPQFTCPSAAVMPFRSHRLATCPVACSYPTTYRAYLVRYGTQFIIPQRALNRKPTSLFYAVASQPCLQGHIPIQQRRNPNDIAAQSPHTNIQHMHMAQSGPPPSRSPHTTSQLSKPLPSLFILEHTVRRGPTATSPLNLRRNRSR